MTFKYTTAGGVLPYVFDIASGSLPPGLQLDTSQGALSGTPTAEGAFSWTIRVTDATGKTASVDDQVTIAAAAELALSGHAVDARQGLQYTYSYSASGGLSPYSWTVDSGSLPPGLSLNASGQIVGTPTSIGNSQFVIKVTDMKNASVTLADSITVAANTVYSGRYWRLLITANNGNDYTSVCKFRLYDKYGNSLTNPGDATSKASADSEANNLNPATNAFNNDFSTKWTASKDAPFPHWLQWDFGTSKAVYWAEVFGQYSGGDLADAAPKDFKIQTSDDAQSWIDVLSVVSQTNWAAAEGRRFVLSASIPAKEKIFTAQTAATHRYWRVVIDQNEAANVSLFKIEFLDEHASAFTTNNASAATASSSDASYPPSKAFDQNDNSPSAYWNASSLAPAWIQYDFGASNPVDVRGVSIKARSDSDSAAKEAPKAFRLQYSDDGTTFTTYATYSGIATWAASDRRMFHDKGFRYVRMFVTKIGNMTQRDFAMGALGYLGTPGDDQTKAYTRQNNTATSSNLAPGQPITHLFNDLAGAIDSNAYTFDDQGLSPTGPWWVTVDLKAGSKFYPQEMFIYPQPHSPENTDRAPEIFTLQGSDDNATWTTIKDYTGLKLPWTMTKEYRVSVAPEYSTRSANPNTSVVTRYLADTRVLRIEKGQSPNFVSWDAWGSMAGAVAFETEIVIVADTTPTNDAQVGLYLDRGDNGQTAYVIYHSGSSWFFAEYTNGVEANRQVLGVGTLAKNTPYVFRVEIDGKGRFKFYVNRTVIGYASSNAFASFRPGWFTNGDSGTIIDVYAVRVYELQDIAAPIVAFEQAVLDMSPLMFLPMRDREGTKVADFSTFGRSGTYPNNALLNQPSIFAANGAAARLPFGQINIPYGTWQDVASDFTIIVGAKIEIPSGNTGQYPKVIAKFFATYDGQVTYMMQGDKGARTIAGRVSTDDNKYNEAAGPNGVMDATARLLTFRRSSDVLDFFHNQDKVGTGSASGAAKTTSQFGIQIGGAGSTDGIDMTAQWIAIYNKALTDAQIANLYAIANKFDAAPSTKYSRAVMAATPFLYWRMDESGSMLSDYSGSNRNGNLYGGFTRGMPSLVNDADLSTQFDGVSSSASSVATIPYSASGTVIAVIKTSTTNGGVIAGFADTQKGDSSAHDRFCYVDTAGKFRAGTWTGSRQSMASNTSVNDNVPHVMAFTWSATGGSVFVDGIKESSADSFTGGDNASRYFRVGHIYFGDSYPSSPSNFFLNGLADEIAYFDRVLSDSEILAIYNASKA